MREEKRNTLKNSLCNRLKKIINRFYKQGDALLVNLLGIEKRRILPLINNTNHELSVFSVVFDIIPGEVWVDSHEHPKCGLIKTPECNVVFGDPPGALICKDLFSKIGYFGTVTCDVSSWNSSIYKYHNNSGIRKYKRLYYSLSKGDIRLKSIIKQTQLLHLNDLETISYKNKEIILDWINIKNQPELENLSIAAVIIEDNSIVSCAAVDCIYENRAEIGIKTMEGFRRRGNGIASVVALLNALLDQGFQEIGWHCVSSNKGSIATARAAGFEQKKEYESYAPFPPIENIDDLNREEWIEYAMFFTEKAEQNPNHFWQAAKCWAKAQVITSSIECINRMIDKNLLWFKDYMDESPEFLRFSGDKSWISLMEKIT